MFNRRSSLTNVDDWAHSPLQAVYRIDGKSTSICKTVLIEKFLVIEYLFLNGSVVKALDS